ncbi:7213_t:CDS:2, partial [Cetraspora pellucida]
WCNEIRDKKDTEFTRQFQEVEAYSQTSPEEIRFSKYEAHPQATYHSKPINTKHITQQLENCLDCYQEIKKDKGKAKETGHNTSQPIIEALEQKGESSTQAQIEVPSK